MESTVKRKDGNNMNKKFLKTEETFGNVKRNGLDSWEKAKSKGKKLWSRAEPARQKAWGHTKSFIQNRPAQSIGFAVLLGVALTILIYAKAKN